MLTVAVMFALSLILLRRVPGSVGSTLDAPCSTNCSEARQRSPCGGITLRSRCRDAERVPSEGPVLILANHPNALIDPLLIATAIDRRVLLTAKATLFERPGLAWLLQAVGVVPLRREGRGTRRRHPVRRAPAQCTDICPRNVGASIVSGGAHLSGRDQSRRPHSRTIEIGCGPHGIAGK